MSNYVFADAFEENRYCLIEYSLESGTLRSNVVWWIAETPPNISSVVILGVDTPVTDVKVNEISQAFEYDTINKVRIV